MRRPWIALAALLFFFLAINAATLARHPSVWVDEVQFADPAVSYASGDGFTSTAWFAQDSTQFWAGNVPLYSIMMAGWLRLFGPGLETERALNLVLFCVFAVLFWMWLRRTNFVIADRWRLGAVAMLLCGHAMVFSYRSGRYDVLGMVLAVVAANCWARAGWRLFSVAALLPFAGLQLLPALLLFSVIFCLAVGRAARRSALAALSGAATGCAGLWLFYRSFHVWQGFRVSTSAIGLIGVSLLTKLKNLPAAYLHDKSAVILAVLLIALLAAGSRLRDERSIRLLGVTGLIVAVLPAALHLTGKFPIYYGWMIFVPLVVIVFHAAERFTMNAPTGMRVLTIAGLTAAAAAGLPLRMAAVAASWSERDPAIVERFVRSSLAPRETVLADFKTYFAVRANGARPFLPTYLPAIRSSERASVTAMVVRDRDFQAAQALLGGEWRATGIRLPAVHTPSWVRRTMAEAREEDYAISVYRRVAP